MRPQAVRTPLAPSQGSVAVSKGFTLNDVSSEGKPLPNRFGLYAGVGFGKTSIAAYAPSPIFIQTRGETGLEALINSGQLPATPHFPEIESWPDLLSAIRTLRIEDYRYKTLVIDTGNGAERLMHEYVCQRDFGGDWTDTGFASYQKGYEVALPDWRLFLNDLDGLRKERNMTIFMLFHSRVKTFRNPSGADYDRYTPEMHDKTWGITRGWLDCIFCGNIEVLVKQGNRVADPSKKGKAADTSHRILCTNSDNPTYDAKNRLGLPEEIDMGDSPREGWTNLVTALKEARKAPVAEQVVTNG